MSISHDQIHVAEMREEAREALIEVWDKSRQTNPDARMNPLEAAKVFKSPAYSKAIASAGDDTETLNGRKCFMLLVTICKSCALAIPAIAASAIPG